MLAINSLSLSMFDKVEKKIATSIVENLIFNFRSSSCGWRGYRWRKSASAKALFFGMSHLKAQPSVRSGHGNLNFFFTIKRAKKDYIFSDNTVIMNNVYCPSKKFEKFQFLFKVFSPHLGNEQACHSENFGRMEACSRTRIYE